MIICEMCGEEIESSVCPFCATENLMVHKTVKPGKLIKINVKEDLPTVEVAMKRVKDALYSAAEKGARAVKVIHGYGSTGKGGLIKQELIYFLNGMRSRGEIEDWIAGEEFSGDYKETVDILKSYPFLENEEDFRKGNRGITIIIL